VNALVPSIEAVVMLWLVVFWLAVGCLAAACYWVLTTEAGEAGGGRRSR
jgi:hypothetical protein